MDITKHKLNLTNILIDIYKDGLLSKSLGFKGGTAALLFYNLPRFSVDLDFDYVGGNNEINLVVEKMTGLIGGKYEIKDQSTKYNTLFWLVSYQKGEHNIKIEISTRDVILNHYDIKNFYGTNVKVLDIKDIIAHKMVAFTERPTLANRDLFDIHYFLGTEYAGDINYEIVKARTGRNPKDFYIFLLENVKKIDPKNILDGLGEVLTDSQKDWAKAKLLLEIEGLINRQIDLVI